MKILNLFKYKLLLLRKSKSVEEVTKELESAGVISIKGFAFLIPIIGMTNLLKVGQRIVNEESGEIGIVSTYHLQSGTIDFQSRKRNYNKCIPIPSAKIIVVMDKRSNKLLLLNPNDWEDILSAIIKANRSLLVEYRHTTHGTVTLTDAFKEKLLYDHFI